MMEKDDLDLGDLAQREVGTDKPVNKRALRPAKYCYIVMVIKNLDRAGAYSFYH